MIGIMALHRDSSDFTTDERYYSDYGIMIAQEFICTQRFRTYEVFTRLRALFRMKIDRGI
ncbi:uncharacterized protein N7500_001741 [Penicillium coprophilum]|uniref:uncharacterized protein n=1 Tax=Penicillium coprophilum TaxID=36646 RepID=UPI00238DF1F9|nr:uncharacterized protein N7500_001741 [Penicillium coprophilum]KAJ5173810.1 hypothetical protein N7500_001741 [Penicillium coprophilum]